MNKLPTIHFSFIPFPLEIWDDNVMLSLAEFRLLGYLLKQIRFGQEIEPVSDDELINGRIVNAKRIDKGCGLTSRNGIKQAREMLVSRGWIEAKNTSSDVTRPRWIYRVRFQNTVTERQEVSQRDTVVSHNDSVVSQRDTLNTDVIETPIEKPKEESLMLLPCEAEQIPFKKAYKAYPKKVAPRDAENAWPRAVRRNYEGQGLQSLAESSEFIYQRIMTYAAMCIRIHKPHEFIPHMATWLNQDRFMDDPTEWAVESNGQTSKAERRNADISETTRKVFDPARHIPGYTTKGLPDKTSG